MTFLAKCQIGIKGKWTDFKAKYTLEEAQALVPMLHLDEGDWKYDWFSKSEVILAGDEIEHLTEAGFTVTLEKVRGLLYGGLGHESENLNLSHARHITYNVSVPNVGLMQVNAVTYEEDCCTDRLQSFLDEGWRILAVCPPNDARRPTYILGRYDPGHTK